MCPTLIKLFCVHLDNLPAGESRAEEIRQLDEHEQERKQIQRRLVLRARLHELKDECVSLIV